MKKVIKILGLFIFTMFIYATYSNAAISASSSTVNSGEEVSVSITSDVAVVSYSVTVTDLGGTTLVTSSGGTGAGTTTITDAKDTGMTSLATFRFKVPEVTTDTTYNIKFKATAMDDVNLNPVADSEATASITVKAPVVEEPEPVVLSTNANLRNLGINPQDFSGFKPGITNYSVEVPYDVEKVSIYAYTQDNKATVAGTGSKTLTVGENSFNIVVTAEDGTTTKTYTLAIKRLTQEETNALNQVEEPEIDLTLSDLKIDGITLVPSFSKNTYIYSAKLTKDLEELEISATASDSTIDVEIEGNENLKEGENEIKIKLSAENGETAEYTITVNKEISEETKGLAVLEIEGITISPSFDPDVYQYVATLTKDLKKLDVKAERADGTTDGIEVTGNEEIVVGENTITILVRDEDSDETLTYQIIITKELIKEEKNKYGGSNIGKYIIIVAAVIILIALIILLKPKKKKDNEEETIKDDDNFNDDDFNPFHKEEDDMDRTQIISNVKDVMQDEKKENIENIKVDRKNEYNVFEDKDLLDNNDIQEEDNDDSYDIEQRKNYLKGKRKGKHF